MRYWHPWRNADRYTDVVDNTPLLDEGQMISEIKSANWSNVKGFWLLAKPVLRCRLESFNGYILTNMSNLGCYTGSHYITGSNPH